MPDHPAMDAIALRGLFDPESLCASQDWKPFRPGIESALIYETPGDGPAAMLLRYQPGAHAPAHRHLGFEHIVVLSGSQRKAVAWTAPSRPGTYKLVCTYHRGMEIVVTVK